MEVVTASPGETEALAARLAERLGPGDVVTISGELGAGKTTFVRGAARALGVTGPVSSPTFTIGHRTRLRRRSRTSTCIGSRGSIRRSGATWSRTSTAPIAFVEWPEHGGDWLPDARAVVTLGHVDESHRSVRIDSDLGL